jgi:glutamine synthetase
MDALHTLVGEKNVEVFGAYDVLSEQELTSRHDIFLEQYALKLNIEANTTEDIARTRVLPAAVRYLRELIETVDELEDLDLDATGTHETASEVNEAVNALRAGIKRLHQELHATEEHEEEGVVAHATHMRDAVTPAMSAVREAADQLERLVPADTWPMPTYREILFVK